MPSATYQRVADAAEAYLTSSGSLSADKAKSGPEIVGALRKRIKAGDLVLDAADGTLLQYLNNAAVRDDYSKIVSGGRRAGYWIETAATLEPSIKPADEQSISSGPGKTVKVSERDLYPLMELWLQEKGYTSKDVSSQKSGGRWGNPDIIGVNRAELFGGSQIEIGSCEIKLGDSGWEQFIFEAISHKRFANRSWFCYRVPSEGTPLPKGMEYYAERFRVGLVQIVLSDGELAGLKSGNKKPLDFIEHVAERFPALHEAVPLAEQRELIDRSGITLTLTF